MFPLPRSIMQVDAGPTPTPTTKAASLQAQIQALTDLHGRLKTLRQIPSLVLKPPTSTSADGLPLSPHSQPSLRTEFEHMKEIGNVIRSDPIQDALRTARDSFQADTKDLNFNLRREHRKRRYVSEISAFFFLPRVTWMLGDPPHPGHLGRMSRSNARARHSFRCWRTARNH